jgi:hypothetical protein
MNGRRNWPAAAQRSDHLLACIGDCHETVPQIVSCRTCPCASLLVGLSCCASHRESRRASIPHPSRLTALRAPLAGAHSALKNFRAVARQALPCARTRSPLNPGAGLTIVVVQRSAGHQGMHMHMAAQVLDPRVQHERERAVPPSQRGLAATR